MRRDVVFSAPSPVTRPINIMAPLKLLLHFRMFWYLTWKCCGHLRIEKIDSYEKINLLCWKVKQEDFSHVGEATEVLKHIQSQFCKLQHLDLLIPLLLEVDATKIEILAVCSTESECTPTSYVITTEGVSGTTVVEPLSEQTRFSGSVRCSTCIHQRFLPRDLWRSAIVLLLLTPLLSRTICRLSPCKHNLIWPVKMIWLLVLKGVFCQFNWENTSYVHISWCVASRGSRCEGWRWVGWWEGATHRSLQSDVIASLRSELFLLRLKKKDSLSSPEHFHPTEVTSAQAAEL